MNVPSEIHSKDSYEWSESISGYPATDWTLKLFLRGPSILDVTATADGVDYLFSIPSTDTANLKPGQYAWEAVVIQGVGVNRHRVGSGSLQVTVSLEQLSAGYESRSMARVTLENLEAIIKKRSTEGFESVVIAGRSVTKMKWTDILTAYSHFKELVRQEEQAEKIARGESARRILVRFPA
jgi:hypothetical protein